MDIYRGFPQFIDALALVQKKHSRVHAVIVGEERVAYGPTHPTGKSYKEIALKEFAPDMSRTHFTGRLALGQYRQVLRGSHIHVYFTRPFILSWSLLEAMSTGCSVVASDTPPVK